VHEDEDDDDPLADDDGPDDIREIERLVDGDVDMEEFLGSDDYEGEDVGMVMKKGGWAGMREGTTAVKEREALD